MRVWDGEPLGDNDFVLSADEKPGVQARYRTRDTLPPAERRPMRVESEYTRGGTLAYFAAYGRVGLRVPDQEGCAAVCPGFGY